MRWHRWFRTLVVALAWPVVVGLFVNVALRLVAHDRWWVAIILNTMTPYLYLPAYLVLVVAIWHRRRILGALATLVVLAHLGWSLGSLAGFKLGATAHASDNRALRLFSTNVMAWSLSTDGIVDEILRSDADVVAVQELSPIWATAFSQYEFARAYPYRIEEVRPDASGSGIYSRVPFVEADILPTPSMPIARATVLAAGRAVRIYSVHALPPSRPEWVQQWSLGLGAIEAAARQETLPVILAGDFNATQHSAWYARFVRSGFRSSHDLCGRPLATTWPNGVLPIPPIRLDHVLLSSEVTCLSIAEGVGSGSDHRPVIVDLGLRTK